MRGNLVEDRMVIFKHYLSHIDYYLMQEYPKRPLFIISQHRTGSTLLRNILDAHSDVAMAFDEMNLFEPFRRNTLDKLLVEQNKTTQQVVKLLSQGDVYGAFWQNLDKSRLSSEEVADELTQYPVPDSNDVVDVVLDLLKLKAGTKYSGVKYPLHFRKLDYLFTHWPDAKVIFLTRNPKSIIASKLNDEATNRRKNRSPLHRFLIHYFTIFYFLIEYNFSIRTYFKNRNRLKLVTYESLVQDSETTIRNLCQWFGLVYEESMLDVTGKSSSHEKVNTSGLHSRSIDKYKFVLNGIDSLLISFLTNWFYDKVKNELNSDI